MKTLLLNKPFSKIANRYFFICVVMTAFFSGSSFAQTNSYLGLDGGFEGTATIDNVTTSASPVASVWKKSNSNGNIASETTNVRTGSKAISVTSTNTTACRLFSPLSTIASTTQRWVVQYYKMSTNTTNLVQSQSGTWRSGAEVTNSTYAGVTTANVWEKVTYSPTNVTASTSVATVNLTRSTGTGGTTYFDDFVIYDGSAPDITAASAPGTLSFSGQTTSSISLSWGAASGGVDGGGYLVVRGTTDPTAAPNVNGIYKVGNTVAAGMTVVYSGTGTNFTDTGLSSSTAYFYRIYTYDKAYNYSAASTGTSNTASGTAIDGVISANEYGTHTNGVNQQSSATGTWYMNWDATNLYIAVAGTNTAEGAIVYLDKNPITPVNGGTNTDGNLVGNAYDGSNFANLQFRADLVLYFKDGYNEYRTADGSGGWSAATTGSSYASTSGTREIAIPWSAIGGRPTSFNWFGYVGYSGGGAYASVPIENPGSGAGTTIGSSATWDRYYTVSTTTIGSSTAPFSRNSYTFTSASDVTGFGAVTAYDFTMNSAGRFVSRTGNVTGNWTIGGNLTVGAGTVYLGSGGSGYGTTSIAGNLNLTGGTFDMDQTTGAVTVAGNVSIASGATLNLSGAVGGDLNVAGNWSNLGTFAANTRLVQFNGSSAQVVNGATSFGYLTLNNALGLTLNNPIAVGGALALTSGKITLGANNLTASGAITANGTNYIVTNGTGQLRQTVGASNVLFPIGNAAYNPITLNNSGTSDVYGVNVLNGAFTALDNTKVVNRRWQVTETVAGDSNLSVVAQYNTGETAANFAAGSNPKIGFYNGSAWTESAATAAGTNPFTYTSISNFSPSDLTSGTQFFAVGKDNAFLSMASQLVITAIAPTSPVQGSSFSVTVVSRDSSNFASNVISDTSFTLTTNGNAGTIGGTVTGTILAGTNSVTISGITLNGFGTGVTVTATRTSGDVLTAATSSTFTVLAKATHLVFGTVPATGNVGINVSSITVQALRGDNTIDANYNGTVTISKASGPGVVSGTLVVAASSGVATFSAVQFDTAGTYTLNATATGLTAAPSSSNIFITLQPVVVAGWDFFGQSSPTTLAATTFSSNLDNSSTLTNITRGPNATSSSGNNSFRTTGFQNDGISTSNNDYFQTTLKIKNGYYMNLSSITGNVIGTATFSASPGVNMQFAYSFDGTTFTLINAPVTVSGDFSTGGTALPAIDVTGVSALQNIPSNTTVYFRFYASGRTATGGWGFYSGTSGTNGLAFLGNVLCVQPVAYNVTGGGAYCSGTTAPSIGLSNSQKGVSYQLVLNGSTNVGSGVPGTGSALNFGSQSTNGTYTVTASNTNAGCNYSLAMNGSQSISFDTSTTWTGATDTSWTTASNWSCGVPFSNSDVTIGTGTFQPQIITSPAIHSLTINSGASLTITSAHNLTVTDAIVNNGTLTVENNANLVQANDVSNTGSGSAIVHRDSNALYRLDYTIWSSPVSGQNLLAFSPMTSNLAPTNIRFYTYNGLNDTFAAVSSAATTDFATATGYLIRMPNNVPAFPTSSIYHGVFTGTPHNGNVSVPTTAELYYGIGNPYPSTISADAFITANVLKDAIYFWRKTNNAAGSAYATYTFAGGASPVPGTASGPGDPNSTVPNGIIQVGQGFITKAPSTSLNFSNAMRVANNAGQFFRSAIANRSRIWLNLTNANGLFSQTLIAYMDNATSGVDDAIDGRYFNDSQTALTSIINNEEFAIQGRALPFVSSDIVPLGFKTALAGDFTISINSTDGLFATDNQIIYLKDNLTGSIHNLSAGDYHFTSDAGVFNTRFEIVYEDLLSTSQPEFTANNVVVYKQGQDIVVNTGTQRMSKVEIYDVRGRLVAQKTKIDATETRLQVAGNQMLIVKITSQNNETVTKKVIN